jgi:hypothetical protein
MEWISNEGTRSRTATHSERNRKKGKERLLKKGTSSVKREGRKERGSSDETEWPRLLPLHEYVVERDDSKRLGALSTSGLGVMAAGSRPNARLCVVGQVPLWCMILEDLRHRRCMNFPLNRLENAPSWLVSCRFEATGPACERVSGRQRRNIIQAPRPLTRSARGEGRCWGEWSSAAHTLGDSRRSGFHVCVVFLCAWQAKACLAFAKHEPT